MFIRHTHSLYVLKASWLFRPGQSSWKRWLGATRREWQHFVISLTLDTHTDLWALGKAPFPALLCSPLLWSSHQFSGLWPAALGGLLCFPRSNQRWGTYGKERWKCGNLEKRNGLVFHLGGFVCLCTRLGVCALSVLTACFGSLVLVGTR